MRVPRRAGRACSTVPRVAEVRLPEPAAPQTPDHTELVGAEKVERNVFYANLT